MTLSIAMVLAILFVALVLFVAEWMRMDLVALVVLRLWVTIRRSPSPARLGSNR